MFSSTAARQANRKSQLASIEAFTTLPFSPRQISSPSLSLCSVHPERSAGSAGKTGSNVIGFFPDFIVRIRCVVRRFDENGLAGGSAPKGFRGNDEPLRCGHCRLAYIGLFFPPAIFPPRYSCRIRVPQARCRYANYTRLSRRCVLASSGCKNSNSRTRLLPALHSGGSGLAKARMKY